MLRVGLDAQHVTALRPTKPRPAGLLPPICQARGVMLSMPRDPVISSKRNVQRHKGELQRGNAAIVDYGSTASIAASINSGTSGETS